MTSHFLEAINGTLLVIFLGLAFFFTRYIALEFMRSDIGWRQARRNRAAAIAMWFLIVGDALIRGSIWAWRHYGLANDNEIVSAVTTAGVVLCVIGGTCGLRYFAPRAWGNWPWVMIPLAGIVFGLSMAFL